MMGRARSRGQAILGRGDFIVRWTDWGVGGSLVQNSG